MEPIIIISILGGLVLILLFSGAPFKPARFIGQAVVKLLIGALLLFFLNTAGNSFGIHVPINFATSAVSGFLGIPGLVALAAIQKFII
ncbi:pro-sigmaK processing inhibitor BofA family protein [Neobacillus drentensis]|uniref:pro-sigmaK processing inhibitor BofA family protein n=1 Tax=Bacillaceae TaxID=186817 RepID=UPI000BA64CFB|nr:MULTISPECIES: pro-sigmaK processing inhibitor BofA family protein [Bacillaceae]PAE31448.1 transcriptional regulator [Bacillus sp. 7884-1]TDL60131.1 pro-sigmaK processing inhibitor BofA [Rhodococcus qingshengii]WHZ03194.1 pro-sigmaK processing inhibitor BofA family protein [Neobacillus sp. YX16]